MTLSVNDGANESLRAAYDRVIAESKIARKYCADGSAFLAANNASANQIIQALNMLSGYNDLINAAKALPGMLQYVKDRCGDQAYDVIAEVNATQAALVEVLDWIVANFPKDPDGYLLKEQFNGYKLNVRAFTPAQTAPLRTRLDAVVATVNSG